MTTMAASATATPATINTTLLVMCQCDDIILTPR